METLNANPVIYESAKDNNEQSTAPLSEYEELKRLLTGADSNVASAVTEECPRTKEEIFDIIRHINDPEHPLTLEQLHVAQPSLIDLDNGNNQLTVHFTPTIPHCSMATLIGLSLKVKLLRSLPPRLKTTVLITPGTHSNESAINKQLNDKERVAAAIENGHLISVVNKCVANSDR